LQINGKDLPLAGLAIQSVTGKWMGPISKWSDFLKSFSTKGYNMIHFTPLNHRGDSNSPYSIYNQLAFSPDLFEKEVSLDEQHTQISKMTSRMETDFGLLALTDVVWNHTAENSDWLQDHPEVGYNLHNSPHLISAYELDTALLDFSSNLRHLGYPTAINSMDDLLKIMEGIKTHVLSSLRLWEFYIVEVAPLNTEILSLWKKGRYSKDEYANVDFSAMSLKDKAAMISKNALRYSEYLGERFKKLLDHGHCASYLYRVFGEYSDSNIVAAQRDLTNLINEINLPFYKEFDSDRETILENIFNRVKYVRLDLKKPEISDEYIFIWLGLILDLLSLRPFSRGFLTMSGL
jgi:glycogen debranching enzyme